jgi:valyl-tRNA synthetase
MEYGTSHASCLGLDSSPVTDPLSTADLEALTRWDPAAAEPAIARRWLASGLFRAEPEGTPAENFSIAIPPPNVTGSLHMGHALNGSIQDVLVRRARMRGQRARWTYGTDHAGIATQRQVEKQLEREGTSRQEIGREAFVERVWRWREEYGGEITGQLKRLGASLDYEDERFTMDPAYVRAVLKVFVDLHERGLIYRDNYMVNWDPGLRSAISDLEVEQREGVQDTLYSIAYPLAESEGEVVVATVRPETMLADTAVAVHPDDERYRELVGHEVVLPLLGRRLAIIADEHVDPAFGTGALKITPGHDPNDFEIGRRHGLEEITVIGEDGRMTAAAGEPFAGLPTAEAQRAVVEALETAGAIRGREPYVHTVPFSHRSGERIEPLISLQWFMRMEELVVPAVEAVTSGRITIHPENWTRVYLNWMENIRPWCISRQLWWGQRIPVWYRTQPASPAGTGGAETYVGTEPPDGEGWTRDPDVLDTWFSSGLWPFATLGWPEQTDALRSFYPTDVVSTGREILFLWVARMVMLGIEFAGDIPFSDVYLHSIIQAPDKRRMSKSLGTGVDPVALIEGGPRPPVFPQGGDFPAYGADAVRFGLLAMSSGQDVVFNEEKIAQGQALANKLWNASRLVLGRIDPEARAQPRPRTAEDRWILSRLQRAIDATDAAIEAFEFSHAALRLYDFVYGELCDWYLELVKPRLYASDDPGHADVSATLLHVLERTLALAHPLIPFVTEAIWAHVPGETGLLAGERAWAADDALVDPGAEASLERVISAVQALRRWRQEVGARPGLVLDARLVAEGYEDTAPSVARLARFAFTDDGGDPAASVSVPGGAMEVLASREVDLGAADRRLDERRVALEAEIERAQRKLANEGFVAKAPPQVVQAEREKLAGYRAELAAL